jgi:hypothetical protein
MAGDEGGVNIEGKTSDADAHTQKEYPSSTIITNNNRNDHPDKSQSRSHPPNWVEKGTLFVLTLTLLAAGYAGYQANRLADLTNQAISDNRDVTKDQRDEFAVLNRASVSLKDIDFVPTKDGDSINWYLEPIFENSGATPTDEMTARINYLAPRVDIQTGFSRCVFDSLRSGYRLDPILPQNSRSFQFRLAISRTFKHTLPNISTYGAEPHIWTQSRVRSVKHGSAGISPI